MIGDHALLVEGEHLLKESGLVLEDAVVDAPEDGTACVVITNMTGLTQRVSEGTTLGEAQAAEVVTADPQATDSAQSCIRRLSSTQIKERRAKLLEALQLKGAHVPHSDAERLCTFLGDNHLQSGAGGARRHISHHHGNRYWRCLSPEATTSMDAIHGPRRSGQAAKEYAARRGDTAIQFTLVQSSSTGKEKGWQPPLLC